MKSIKSIVLFALLISNIFTADFLSDNSKINNIIKPLAEKVFNRYEKVIEYKNQNGIQMNGPNGQNNQQMGGPNSQNNQQMNGPNDNNNQQMGGPNGNNNQQMGGPNGQNNQQMGGRNSNNNQQRRSKWSK